MTSMRSRSPRAKARASREDAPRCGALRVPWRRRDAEGRWADGGEVERAAMERREERR